MKVSPEKKPVKRSFILTASEVEKLLLQRDIHSWLLWQDTNGHSRLSIVIQLPRSLLNKVFVMHAAKSQESEWEHLMQPTMECPETDVLSSLSNERLQNQIFGNQKTPLTILNFIAILQARRLSNESITNLIPKNLEQLNDPDIKNKILGAISDIADRQQRIALCTEILDNKLHPYSQILRMSESWFFDAAPSKARILNILQQARIIPPEAPAPPESPPKPVRKKTESAPKPPLTREEIERRKRELLQDEYAVQNQEIAHLSDMADSLLNQSKNAGLFDRQKATTPYLTETLDAVIEVQPPSRAPASAPAPQRLLSQKPAERPKPAPAPAPTTAKMPPVSSEDEDNDTSEDETPTEGESTGLWKSLFG